MRSIFIPIFINLLNFLNFLYFIDHPLLSTVSTVSKLRLRMLAAVLLNNPRQKLGEVRECVYHGNVPPNCRLNHCKIHLDGVENRGIRRQELCPNT